MFESITGVFIFLRDRMPMNTQKMSRLERSGLRGGPPIARHDPSRAHGPRMITVSLASSFRSVFPARYTFTICALLLVACGGDSPNYSVLEYHLIPASSETAQELAMLQAELPFDSLELERGGECLGPCPEYLIRLRRDGTALYHGMANIDVLGERHADLGRTSYARLVQFIDEQSITDMPTDIPRIADASWYWLRIWPTGSVEPWVKQGPSGGGAMETWILRSAIDGLLLRPAWEETPTLPYHEWFNRDAKRDSLPSIGSLEFR